MGDGRTAGRTIPLSDFYLAKPGDSVQRINLQLAQGKHLLLTPGMYDIDRWRTNIGRKDAVINGDGVVATGLFVEHFPQHDTTWNGENGTVVLYQNELPYDPPTQADWMTTDGTLGWAGSKVGDDVKNHKLFGAGVYVFNQNNPAIRTSNGFQVRRRSGVKLHHIMTVNLSAGVIDHVVNGVGGPADTTKIGVPVYVNDYPAP